MFRSPNANLHEAMQCCKNLEDELSRVTADDEAVLFRFTKADVDCVLEGLGHNTRAWRERATCYEAVSRMDMSAIFEQIETVCQVALEE
jgi:hypothetical protein